jgi:hypothetical protein
MLMHSWPAVGAQLEEQRTAHFFAFSLIIEGTTEKVLQNIMPPKAIYNKTLVSSNKLCKMYF